MGFIKIKVDGPVRGGTCLIILVGKKPTMDSWETFQTG